MSNLEVFKRAVALCPENHANSHIHNIKIVSANATCVAQLDPDKCQFDAEDEPDVGSTFSCAWAVVDDVFIFPIDGSFLRLKCSPAVVQEALIRHGLPTGLGHVICHDITPTGIVSSPKPFATHSTYLNQLILWVGAMLMTSEDEAPLTVTELFSQAELNIRLDDVALDYEYWVTYDTGALMPALLNYMNGDNSAKSHAALRWSYRLMGDCDYVQEKESRLQ